MPSGTHTPKLNLMRIQETWQFGDEAFNRFIDDADNKLVGESHLSSSMHWTEWKPQTAYSKGDVVRYPNLKSHQYAVCISVNGISDIADNMPSNNITGSIFTDGTVKWEVRSLTEASTNGGTIKIWLAGSYYFRGDAVRYGDALYRAKIDHEASNNFETDENWWQEIYASIRFWKPNIYYYLDDTAIYDDIIYKCIRAHKSVASFETVGSVTGDEEDWEIIGGAGGAKNWATNTKYQYGQLVLVNGILYRSNIKHKSDSTSFSNDIANWDLVDAQIHDWQTNEYYVAGTLVSYNNIIYKCLSNHTSSNSFEVDISNWVLYHNYIVTWSINTSYYQGQLVLYENRLYKCNNTHVSSSISFLDDIANFDVIYASLSIWGKNITYKIGDIVLYNNEPFRCVKNHLSGNSNTSTIFDNITGDNNNCWERIKLNNPYIIDWGSNIVYDVGQLVLYNGTLYRCNNLHISGNVFDSAKWDLVYANIQPWTTGIVYKENSIILYNGGLYVCLVGHTSTAFNTDSSNWLKLSGETQIQDWVTNQSYAKDKVVMVNGILYRAKVTHTAGSTFESDIDKWEIVYSNIPIWTTGNYYPLNTLVSYNNLVYRCSTAHTASSEFNSDINNWILYNNSITTWATNSAYKAGQVVIHNNVLYKCLTDHESNNIFNASMFSALDVDIKHEIPDYMIEQGMNVKVTMDKKLIANDLCKCVRATGKEEEINKLGLRDLKNEEIFKAWKTYTCNSNGTDWNDKNNVEQMAAKDSYSFDIPHDAIICNRNNDAFSAFISQEVYEPDFTVEYTIDNRILAEIAPSLVGDDDALFFIAGFMQDANNNYHTLSVIRVGDTEGGHGMRFAIVYDVYTSWLSGVGSTAKVLANNTSLIAHDWDGNSYALLEVQKSSTGIIAKTSEINSSTYAVTLTYTLPATKPSDMTQEQYDNIKYMLEHDTKIGFGTQSNCSAFKLLNSSGSIKRISVYNTDTKKKVTFEDGIQVAETDDTKVLLPQEFVYSKLNKRLYYVKSDTEIQEILLNNTINDWVSEEAYVEGAVVNYQGSLYRCIEFNFDAIFNPLKWEFLGAVPTWDSNVYYPYHKLCVYQGSLYRCIIPHTSISTFVSENWEELSGSGGGSGSGDGYSQIEAYNVVASNETPYIINIPIESNATHTLYPTDVLKYKAGLRGTENIMTFNSTDAEKLEYNEDYVTFEDAKMKIKQKLEVSLSPAINLGSGYLRMSNEIYLNDKYKSVENVM